MTSLVVYYSRTGNTAKISKEISSKLKVDLEKVADLKKRAGAINWLLAGRDGSLKKTTKIGELKYKPENYDLVIIGTPIWVNTTPAIRTYLKQNRQKLKKVAFFCTMGGRVSQRVFDEMRQLCGQKPLATLAVRDTEIKQKVYEEKLKKFIQKIKGHL